MVGIGVAILLMIVGAIRGLGLFDLFFIAVAAAVAFIPEGLPAIVTIVFAIGVQRMAKRNAIIRKLPAVESLGSTTVICTDKTGTLTENRMRAARVWTPLGELDLEHAPGLAASAAANPVLGLLGRTAAACSTAELRVGKSRGEATEVGLLEAARQLGVDVDVTRREHERRRLFRFDPTLRLMSTVDQRADGGLTVHVKGAPEEVLARATMIGGAADHLPLTDADRDEVLDVLERYASLGLRVLAIARRRLPDGTEPPDQREEAERGLCLLGLIGLFDPPRPEVAGAVTGCHAAGIRILVVTGDYGPTAAEIARRVGIGHDGTVVVTGEELHALDERSLERLLAGGRELIFARSSPEAKLRIADALRSEGHVVAMTGDGVNDAPPSAAPTSASRWA
jgi:magnesium-transporting ATPase (P-type)